MLGREVATLVHGELEAGEHSVVYNAKGLKSGVYSYRLTTTTFSQTNVVEIGKGEFHPQTSLRTVCEPLDSYGSSNSYNQ